MRATFGKPPAFSEAFHLKESLRRTVAWLRANPPEPSAQERERWRQEDNAEDQVLARGVMGYSSVPATAELRWKPRLFLARRCSRPRIESGMNAGYRAQLGKATIRTQNRGLY